MKRSKHLSTLLALCLTLTLLPWPALAAESATATAMQLVKTEGAVSLANGSGRSLTSRDGMRLYNGYSVETKAKSYAWVNLDDTKLAKLDAVSKAEVRKSGKKLELLVSSGNIFFNITSPLKDDEILNIRTSTMIVGIRGTSGWIKVIDRWAAEIYVLEGTIRCDVTDPVTGQTKTAEIHGGEKAVATAYPQDKAGDKCDILMDRFEPDDISGFVLAELVQNPGLCGDIYEETGMDVPGFMGLLESVRRQLDAVREELDSVRAQLEGDDPSIDEAQAKLDGLRRQLEDIKEQLERAEPDDGARRRLAEAEEHLRQAQGALNSARTREAADHLDDAREKLEGAQQGQSDGALEKAGEEARERQGQEEQEVQGQLDGIGDGLDEQDHDVSNDPVWEQSPAPDTPNDDGGDSGGGTADQPADSEFRMHMTADEVRQYLNDHGPGTYTLLASAGGNNMLTVDSDLTIPSGTTLNLAAGIDIVIESGSSLTVDGTLSGTGTLTNNGTLTVNSSDTLSMQSIVSDGVLINAVSGRIVANDIFISADFTNFGAIQGGVTVNSGTFTMNGGTIDGGTGIAVTLALGTSLVMNGGEITSSHSLATISNDGNLVLNGGTIINSGTGHAILIASAGSVSAAVNTAVQANQKFLFNIFDAPGQRTPDGYAPRYEDGRYCLVEAEASGDCGTDALWDYRNGALTISGKGAAADVDSWSARRDQIETVIISKGITGVGGAAFENCGNLTSVTIPSSVTDIGYAAFEGCGRLTSVYYGGSEEEWNRITIQDGNTSLRDATKTNGTDTWQ